MPVPSRSPAGSRDHGADRRCAGLAYALCLLSLVSAARHGRLYPQAAAWLERGLVLYQQAGDIGRHLAGLLRSGRDRHPSGRTGASHTPARTKPETAPGDWGQSGASPRRSAAWHGLRSFRVTSSARRHSWARACSSARTSAIRAAWPGAWKSWRRSPISSKDDGRAARIYGAAAALRASVNSVIDPTDQPEHDRVIARIRARLGDEVYEAVWAEGQTMLLEQPHGVSVFILTSIH